MYRWCLFIIILIVSGPLQAVAEDVLVAVAANFTGVLQDLARTFEDVSAHQLTIVSGSTGKLYAQIVNGAPFDVFLAADADRPARLESADRMIPGSRFTYALGSLVLWSPQAGYIDTAGSVLVGREFDHLAIANPQLAPYGRAARELLEQLGLWDELQDRIVKGESVAQAMQFVASGNAPLGLLALSQTLDAGGSAWIVPQEQYTPIRQQAVLLQDSPGAREFLGFLQSDEARSLIASRGYRLPPRTEVPGVQ